MDDDQIAQLEGERSIGNRAKAANSEFFEPFFEEKEKVLIEAFRNVSVTNSEALLNIKLQFKALDTLNDELQSFIDTGKMASITLTEIEENKDDNRAD